MGSPYRSFINFEFFSMLSAFEQSHHILFNYNNLCRNTGHHFGSNYTTGSEWDSWKIKRRSYREKSIHSRHTSRFDQVSFIISVPVFQFISHSIMHLLYIQKSPTIAFSCSLIVRRNAFAEYLLFVKSPCTNLLNAICKLRSELHNVFRIALVICSIKIPN